jgi:hypothetical protein
MEKEKSLLPIKLTTESVKTATVAKLRRKSAKVGVRALLVLFGKAKSYGKKQFKK